MAEHSSTIDGFKRHEHEFFVLREDLKRIQLVGVESKKSIGSIKNYFNEVMGLYIVNSDYLTTPKKVGDELESINDKLNDVSYLKDIKTLNANSEIKIKLFEYKMYKKIDDILKRISSSFVQFQLRPRPTKQYSSVLDNPNLNAEERREFYALKQMGIEVRENGEEDKFDDE